MKDFLFSITVTKEQMSLFGYLCFFIFFFLCLYFFYIMKGVKKHLDELIEKYQYEHDNLNKQNEESRQERKKLNEEMITELKKLKHVVGVFQRGKAHDDV